MGTMLTCFAKLLMQQPPPPTPEETPSVVVSPAIFVVIALIIAGILAWKYRATLEFLIILCSTLGGFIVGFAAAPPYGNVGLGMMIALASLLFSLAAILLVKLALKMKREDASET